MKSSLLRKFLFCYLLLAALLFAILNTYGIRRIRQGLVEEKESVLYEEAKILCDEYVSNYYMNKLSYANLRTQLRSIDAFLDARIWIVQKDGTVILDTRNPSVPSEGLNVNEREPGFLSGTFFQGDQFAPYFNEEMLSVVYPVTTDYDLKGYIALHSSLQRIRDDSVHYADMINVCFLIFLAAMLLVFAYLARSVIRPLRRLISGAHQYCNGNLGHEIDVESADGEYRDLAGSLRYMADRIASLNDYQKKFVANISHDFRSPLTSIRGYVEAMRDGTIPPEMQGKYLEIILFETDRLASLTSELLELSRYETNGVFLEISSFDINRVIKQTAESFEGACTRKGIHIQLVFSEKELFVDADMGKIQQVLHNLIDNAIKFSGHGSAIRVSTDAMNEKAFVSVKDYGCGIPKEEQKKVWDRFYKIDSSRGKDQKGTGLGLSITKEIINAHNENINLTSTEGVGSEFTFSLPRSGAR